MKKENFILTRIKSFQYAFAGLWDMLTTEPNAWIHAGVTIAVLGFSWWFQIGRVKFTIIILAIMSVWAAEAFNTVLEIVMDVALSKQYSPAVKRAKDISAAAVLVACMGAVLIGIIILGPFFFEHLKNILW